MDIGLITFLPSGIIVRPIESYVLTLSGENIDLDVIGVEVSDRVWPVAKAYALLRSYRSLLSLAPIYSAMFLP